MIEFKTPRKQAAPVNDDRVTSLRVLAEASNRRLAFITGWGLSVLAGPRVLFDTFSSGKILRRQFIKYGIDPLRISHVVISHEHWDHTGGLWWLLSENKGITVHVCGGFSSAFKQKILSRGGRLKEQKNRGCVTENLFSTGEIKFKYKGFNKVEQSLIIDNGTLTVLTGCSHAGIKAHLNRVCEIFPLRTIDLFLGGFHLMNSPINEIDGVIKILSGSCAMKRIAPLHCTGARAVSRFRKAFPDRLIKVKTGQEIKVG